ncbi:MAG: hypothetical protein COB10_03785 [Planctomycetota bacterium]|nr:MAG: hypothetical protein COB10_03785 [Planctomycetota bacterium]HIC23604.1 hypothetical protein [Planctomycetota bacterium]
MPQEDKTIEDVMSEPKEVVRKIRFLIDTHHETVPGLARGVGVLPDTIQDVLDGQSLPSSALVRRIAQRFALPVEFFSSEVSRDPRPKRSVSSKGKAVSQKSEPNPESAATGSQHEVRLQKALVELLIQKGVISADEWNARIRLVTRRSSTTSN